MEDTIMSPAEKEILIDIYGDLAQEHGWPWHPDSSQIFMERQTLPYYIAESVASFGKNHPKFPLISKLISISEKDLESPANCHNRQDWWVALVKMLDDSKLYLSETNRKELYLDLSNLISHRLERKEY